MPRARNGRVPLMNLSVVIITLNEEANLGRTLASVKPLVADGKGEIIVVDSGSTDRTVEIAKSFGAKVFVEEWKGYAAQKNSAIDKATGDWILSLDADEELDSPLQQALQELLEALARLSTFGKLEGEAENNRSLPTPDAKSEPTAIPHADFVGLWIPGRMNSSAAGSGTAASGPIPSCASSVAEQADSRTAPSMKTFRSTESPDESNPARCSTTPTPHSPTTSST